MPNEETETPIELSDEMLEAIRIIKSDGHTREIRELKESHVEILRRLDAQQVKKDENAQEEKTEPNTPKDTGIQGSPIPGNGDVPNAPQPPPRIEAPTPPEKKGRTPWWERDTYAHE